MERIGGIYKIQSMVKPEKIYIGSAVSFINRKRKHFWELRKGIHTNEKLQRHYNKYGKSDLQFSILLECNHESLIKNEQFYIDRYNPFFNNAKIAGKGTNLGLKFSQETKDKISKALMGNTNGSTRIMTEELRFKCGSANRGKKLSEEKRKNLSLAHTGIKMNLTEEQHKKRSERMKGNTYWKIPILNKQSKGERPCR